MTESIIKESKIPPKTLGDNACDETERGCGYPIRGS